MKLENDKYFVETLNEDGSWDRSKNEFNEDELISFLYDMEHVHGDFPELKYQKYRVIKK